MFTSFKLYAGNLQLYGTPRTVIWVEYTVEIHHLKGPQAWLVNVCVNVMVLMSFPGYQEAVTHLLVFYTVLLSSAHGYCGSGCLWYNYFLHSLVRLFVCRVTP